MEDVAMRCVIQHLAQGASVSEQIELRTLRDLEEKLTERFACAVRKGEKLEKLVRLVLLPPRNKRRPFAVEHEAERADPACRIVARRGRYNRLVRPHRFQIHCEVASMARGLRQTTARVRQRHWKGIASNQPAATSPPFGQHAVSAQQRAVTNHEQRTIRFRRQPNTSMGNVAGYDSIKSRAGFRVRQGPWPASPRADRAPVGCDIRRDGRRYRGLS